MARFHHSLQLQQLIIKKYNPLNSTISSNSGSFGTHQVTRANKFFIKRNFYYNIFSSNSVRHYSSEPGINKKNIYKGPVYNVPNYHGMLFHQFIWKDIDNRCDKIALECSMTKKSYTYEQLRRSSGKFATSLRKCKLRPGDTIAVIISNIPEYAIILMGASEAGIRVTPINPHYTTKEIRRQLINSETAALITTPSKIPSVVESILGNPDIRLPLIIVDDGFGSIPSGTINFKDLISDYVEEFEKTGHKTEQDPEIDTFVLPYSRRTPGFPKGIELTHRNLVANCCQLQATYPKNIGHQEIIPLFMPFNNFYGFIYTLSHYLSLGAKMICMPHFTSTGLLKILEQDKVTSLFVDPSIIQLLAYDGRFTRLHFENVRHVLSEPVPMDNKIIDKFLTRVGTHVDLGQRYSLIETSMISNSSKAPYKSSGLILPETEIRIVGYECDNKGKNLGPREVGQIYVKGPQVMKGYLENSEDIKDKTKQRWFKTGDLGFVDEQGFLYVQDRLKKLIEVQGYQVEPRELEDILQGHEKVADAIVIGVQHDKYGEVPKAFIVPKPNMHINEQEIKKFVAKRVADYKQLKYVDIINKVSKNSTKTILRRKLKNYQL